MKKKVTNITNPNKKLIIGLVITSAVALTSLGSIINNTLEKNESTETLEYYLESYGYENAKEMSLQHAGYNIGYQNSYYQINYDLNTNSEVTSKKEIFNKLKDVYQGKEATDYQKGLTKGINEGTKDATEYYLNKTKTR